MKKTATSTVTLPISRNAYKRFVGRIRQVYLPDAVSADAMIAALDAYLAGGPDAVSLSDRSMLTAFAFLRQEVDVAIERSRRARERARLRKPARGADEGLTMHVHPEAPCEKPSAVVEDTSVESKKVALSDAACAASPVVKEVASPAELSAPGMAKKVSAPHSARPSGGKDRCKRRRIKFRKIRK